MLPALVSPFGGAAAAAFQLARCLAPHLRLALTPALGPRRTFSSLPSLAELPLAPSDYPRFNPDACAAFSPHGAALETHDRSQAFFSVLSLYRWAALFSGRACHPQASSSRRKKEGGAPGKLESKVQFSLCPPSPS